MFKQICEKILSPPKLKYSLYDLGPCISKQGKRSDFIIHNKFDKKMNCSYYQPHHNKYPKKCIIYLHSMNGSRLQSTVYVDKILSLGIAICSFDFSGCGNSDGIKITFGANQKYDVQALINKLKVQFHIKKFIFWGRSMGAVCAVKYTQMIYERSHLVKSKSQEKDEIIGIILDSPFRSFSKLVVEIGSTQSEIPKFLVQAGYFFIKKSLQQNGQFQVSDLQLISDKQQQVESNYPMSRIKGNNLPILFLASKQDKTVSCQHSIDMFNAYQSTKKQLKFFKGLHNSSRDQDYILEVTTFITKILQTEKQSKIHLTQSKISHLKHQQASIPKILKKTSSKMDLYKKSQGQKQFQQIQQKKRLSYAQQSQNKSSIVKMIQQQEQLYQKSILQNFELQSELNTCQCTIFSSKTANPLYSDRTIKKFKQDKIQQDNQPTKRLQDINESRQYKKSISSLSSNIYLSTSKQFDQQNNLMNSIKFLSPIASSQYVKPIIGQLSILQQTQITYELDQDGMKKSYPFGKYNQNINKNSHNSNIHQSIIHGNQNINKNSNIHQSTINGNQILNNINENINKINHNIKKTNKLNENEKGFVRKSVKQSRTCLINQYNEQYNSNDMIRSENYNSKNMIRSEKQLATRNQHSMHILTHNQKFLL